MEKRKARINKLLFRHLDALKFAEPNKECRIVAIGSKDGIERFSIDTAHEGLVTEYHTFQDALAGAVSFDKVPKEHKVAINTIKNSMLDHKDQITLIVLVDNLIPTLRYFHSITSPLKDMGCIVATLYNRPIYIDPITDDKQHDDQVRMFRKAGQFALGNNGDGDYFEFGVFDGRTVTLAYQAFARKSNRMRLFGFDTFRGIVGTNKSEESSFPVGSFYSNIETFRHNMRTAGISEERFIGVAGDFLKIFKSPQDIYARYSMKKCALAHIDCDVYEAAKSSLNFLSPLLTQGSILLFDEFNVHKASNEHGERRALREWLADNPQFEVERWYDYGVSCRSYFVHERPIDIV